jgi:anti-sigma regulatory factor (Ser/Thr protein kinase)
VWKVGSQESSLVQQEGRAVGTGGVLRSADTNQGGVSFAHQALLYGSEAEFLAGTVPFVRDALECGDPIRIVITDRGTDWLRGVLGADARHVAFWESSQWYAHPARALAELHRTAQEATAGGRRLRMIGEPWWRARTGQESRAWARHESLVNAALAVANAALVCAYDTRIVGPDVMATAARTHPELLVKGAPQPSPGYIDPVVFNAECNRCPLPELPSPTLWLRFRRVDQLATLRAFVTSHAAQAGATTQSVAQFVQAVDEVATNAIMHGGGAGVLQIWIAPQTMVCEISDTGAGLRDPLAGHLPPDRFAAGGHGLWLARQFSDHVEVHSDPTGTTVRLYLARP